MKEYAQWSFGSKQKLRCHSDSKQHNIFSARDMLEYGNIGSEDERCNLPKDTIQLNGRIRDMLIVLLLGLDFL
jgi:hypothetical protein